MTSRVEGEDESEVTDIASYFQQVDSPLFFYDDIERKLPLQRDAWRW